MSLPFGEDQPVFHVRTSSTQAPRLLKVLASALLDTHWKRKEAVKQRIIPLESAQKKKAS
jgi:hypothetical protein